MTDIDAKFWKHVNLGKPDECWLWAGGTDRNGYGMCCIPRTTRTGKRQKWTGAHRVSYAHHFNGAEPLVVRHSCKNKSCVNPAHLRPGTYASNAQDESRFQPGDIRRIRAAYKNGEKQASIAKRYGVTQAAISAIVTRKTWKDVR